MTRSLPRPARRRAALALSAATALTLALTACGGDSLEEEGGGSDAGGRSLTIGGANFTEATVLIELYAQILREEGFDTETTPTEGREIYGPELESGAIDIVPEYAATAAEYYNAQANGPEAEPVATPDVTETVEALRELTGPRGLTVLDPGEAVDQNAFAVTEEFAEENGLTTLTDLGESGLSVRLAAGEDCATRPFCEPGLEETYGIDIAEVDPLGVGTTLAKQSVADGENDLVLVTTTDGTLPDFGLTLLEDDRNLQLADNVLPVVNTESAGDEEIAAALGRLTEALTTEDLVELNRQVDAERRTAEDVARDWLTQEGLIGG
ncbi:ABC transporter substrate-binding protein [Streptomyces sp. DSM 44917]|uniref:ABC transporter substrate-binding protein n=1 Tax=Streptomyces boetiae TaxID=3075541 RepID=A0ABU2LBU4_9ACTN|nr:ABC transporter substrate-binding protein [Streptomyces sp. DSM 44917]MDT0308970.1 ABC transporter substrate-binding protein [Streptomyces sp. DSM 44917]